MTSLSKFCLKTPRFLSKFDFSDQMSSNANHQTEMTNVIRKFLNDLRRLSVLNLEGSSGFYHVNSLYETAYDFSRYIHLYPEFLQSLTDDDKNFVKEHFPNALPKLVGFTPGLINNIKYNVNTARTKRSQIFFIKNEIVDLYKQVNQNTLSTEIEKFLQELEKSNNILESTISDLTDPENDETDDDPDDVPNLNGVPSSHDWWSEEYRQMWKNKTNP